MVIAETRAKTGRNLLLAGDIGGTNTRLGLFEATPGLRRVQGLIQRSYPSREYDDLETIVGDFLGPRRGIAAACFGVAGPVVRGEAVATNLPWKISERSLGRKVALRRVSLINDLVANAYGVLELSGRDFRVLHRGTREPGNAAMLSAGTGLGEAILFWNGRHHVPHASEGGHAEFGPRNRIELELLEYLFERFGHVSYERVISGMGLLNIYHFLRDSGRHGREPAWLRERMQHDDPAAVITEAARRRTSALCSGVLDLFVSIYGAEAGNLALQVMATGGIYIGGGIAPRIIWKLTDGTFMKAFRRKGRLSRIVERIPVKVVMNDRAALLGAAVRAAELSGR